MIQRFEQTDPELKKMLIVSVAFHVAIFLVFTVKTAFFPTDIPAYQPAIRVDLVGLPDKRNPEKPVVTPKPEAIPEPAKPNVKEETPKAPAKEVKKADSGASQVAALNKLKSLSAIEKLKNMEVGKSKEEAKPQAMTEPEVIKGNVLSVGTSLKGLNKLQFDEYIGSLDVHVKNNWALPEWMLAQNFRAEVYIRLDRNGNLIERKLRIKSGNSEFDQRVMDALEKSNPFPAPPEKFVDLVGIQGITFAFPE